MATETEASLNRFANWIRLTDPHASFHLPLLAEAERALADPSEGGGSAAQRRLLAAKLERWRYQHLNQRRGKLAPEDRRLADALDLAANELAGGTARWPRSVRPAIRDAGYDPPAIAEARACLDPTVTLDEVVSRARELTAQNFGVGPADVAAPRKQRIALYAPLYLSSHCINHCTYCGFRYPHQIKRRHLTVEEALREAEILGQRGFRHILLVAGDFPGLTTVDYHAAIVRKLSAGGFQPTVEIAPQSTQAYAELCEAGTCGVTLYQETYAEDLYGRYHPRGSKASFDWRLEGLDRAAEAGMRRLGLGFLLGLADPREDLAAMMRHGRYLQSRFPDRVLAFSLPRIREAPDGFREPYQVDDETFVRLYCSLRVAFPQAELVLSTREPPALRNQLATICITQLSAGSCTVPGGYEEATSTQCRDGQFPISDHRSVADVAGWLRSAGFELAWDLAECSAHDAPR